MPKAKPMKPLKVWSVVADGRNRLLVATDSMREAARLCGISEHAMRTFGNETGNRAQTILALANPGIVFTQPINGNAPFQPAEVKPYVKRPVPAKVPENRLQRDLQSLLDRKATVRPVPHHAGRSAAGVIESARALLAALEDVRPTITEQQALKQALQSFDDDLL